MPVIIDNIDWYPANWTPYPKKPKNTPNNPYVIDFPKLYKSADPILLPDLVGIASANGPHMPMQCTLPRSPMIKPDQIMILEL